MKDSQTGSLGAYLRQPGTQDKDQSSPDLLKGVEHDKYFHLSSGQVQGGKTKVTLNEACTSPYVGGGRSSENSEE